MKAKWHQPLASMEDGIKFMTAVQDSISRRLPDPEDWRHFTVGKELERLACQFFSSLLFYSLRRVLAVGKAWGSFVKWLVLL